ncbi:hypothetical protein CDCA_CDCA15G4080 [Cyanidium caldarium]|uniref:Uncharacterized protein n=1 Tax=Cyanidium caldarium TaxID=2771 RepID=A0AAV9J0E5_CYACA|nr:hypothetical protein CDCA_CDCA15G4080 [Cyanidium caldarium]
MNAQGLPDGPATFGSRFGRAAPTPHPEEHYPDSAWPPPRPPFSSGDPLSAVISEKTGELERARQSRLRALEEQLRERDDTLRRLQLEHHTCRQRCEQLETEARVLRTQLNERDTQWQRSQREDDERQHTLTAELRQLRDALASEQANREETERLGEKLAASFDAYLEGFERRYRQLVQRARRQEQALHEALQAERSKRAPLQRQWERDRLALHEAQRQLETLQTQARDAADKWQAQLRELQRENDALQQECPQLREQLRLVQDEADRERERFLEASREAYAMLDESAARNDALETQLEQVSAQLRRLRTDGDAKVAAEQAHGQTLERELESQRTRTAYLEERWMESQQLVERLTQENAKQRSEVLQLRDELARVQARCAYAEKRLEQLLRDTLQTPPAHATSPPSATRFLPRSTEILGGGGAVAVGTRFEPATPTAPEENASFRARVRAYLGKQAAAGGSASRHPSPH